MKNERVLLKGLKFQLTIQRLCHQLIENHQDFSQTAIIGLQPRGVFLAERIVKELQSILKNSDLDRGNMDITFYRDDFRRREKPLVPSKTDIEFSIENKKVILIDDVLYTGRTIRAGLDAMLAFGRPQKVECLVLIDRRFSRQLPIQPDYVGKKIDSVAEEKVIVNWKEKEGEDKVILYTEK